MSKPNPNRKKVSKSDAAAGKDPETGHFSEGNKFWQARSTFGRNPKFSDPADLAKACEEYFQWVADNPLYEHRLIAYMGEATIEKVPKMRAMTIDGLGLFLGIAHDTWESYRKKSEFAVICANVDKVIRDQKFSGAAADLLNASIIARDLGLVDKKEHSGPGGGPIGIITLDVNKLTTEQLKALRDATIADNDS